MDPITTALGFVGKLLAGGLINSFTTWRSNRGEAARVQFQDYFGSLEKQIDSAEKRSDESEVTRLRNQYEEEQEAWRAQQKLELSAPREVGEDSPILTTGEIQNIKLLLVEAKNTPVVTVSAVGYFLRGNAYHAAGEYEDAISEYSQAIRLNPELVEAYLNRGSAYGLNKQYGHAKRDFDETIRLSPDNDIAYYNRGLAHYLQEEYELALDDYDEAIRLNPDYSSAYNNRGVSYNAKADHDRAIEDYNEAIRLSPYHASTYSNRGTAYHAKGERERAIEDYGESIGLDPEYAEAYSNRANVFIDLGRFVRAIEECDEAIRLNPELASAYTNRGVAQIRMHNYRRALQNFRVEIKLLPDNGIGLSNIAFAQFGLGMKTEARASASSAASVLSDLIAGNSREGNLYASRALSHAILGNIAETEEDKSIAVSLGYDDKVLREQIEEIRRLNAESEQGRAN